MPKNKLLYSRSGNNEFVLSKIANHFYAADITNHRLWKLEKYDHRLEWREQNNPSAGILKYLGQKDFSSRYSTSGQSSSNRSYVLPPPLNSSQWTSERPREEIIQRRIDNDYYQVNLRDPKVEKWDSASGSWKVERDLTYGTLQRLGLQGKIKFIRGLQRKGYEIGGRPIGYVPPGPRR